MTLMEKGVSYAHEDFDFLQGMPEDQVARHPFGKVPAFEHDGMMLYETAAITRYIDEVFSGPALQPGDPRQRGRLAQIICIIDSYAYNSMITRMFIPRIVAPMVGRETDEAVVKAAFPDAAKSMAVLNGFVSKSNYLVGDALTLADLHFVPVYGYFLGVQDGSEIVAKAPALHRWWEQISQLKSVQETTPKL
jgi:glutathione S-transferase